MALTVPFHYRIHEMFQIARSLGEHTSATARHQSGARILVSFQRLPGMLAFVSFTRESELQIVLYTAFFVLIMRYRLNRPRQSYIRGFVYPEAIGQANTA